MKLNRFWISAVGAMALVGMTSALAQAPAETGAPHKGETVVSSQKVTATVTKVDQITREVTVKTQDGQERTFVAGEAVKNLAQVKPGDVVTAVYTEAIAYEVKKGGKTGADSTAAAAGAPLGAKPAGVVAHQTTVTVKITAIDPSVPSVTFLGPEGHTQTIKVRYPERLKGVSVGDTVELTYTEALAVKVEVAPKL